MKLTLPVPPSGNASYRTGRGHFYRSKAAQSYHDTVELLCKAQRVTMMRGPITLEVKWYRARRAGDLDGRLKVLQDALQGRAYANDSQIVKIIAERFEDKDNPRMQVTITDYEDTNG